MTERESIKTLKDLRANSEILAIVLLLFTCSQAVALMTFNASSHANNILGLYGHITAAIWFILFGPVSFIAVLALGFLTYLLFIKELSYFSVKRLSSLIVALFSLSLMLVLLKTLMPELELAYRSYIHVEPEFSWLYKLGGLPMEVLYLGVPYLNLSVLFSTIGTALLASTTLFLSLLVFFDLELSWCSAIFKRKEVKKPQVKEKDEPFVDVSFKRQNLDSIDTKIHFSTPIPVQKSEATIVVKKPPIEKTAVEKSPSPASTFSPSSYTLSSYNLPSSDLLSTPKAIDLSDMQKELKEKATLLEETLLSFGIEAKVGEIHCGPRITLFEVHPAIGVKVGKIKTLEHDIALNMKAKSIRIIAPIPGKAAVGIEIPNQHAQDVSFSELLTTYKKQGAPHKIPMVLGKAVNGDQVICDLTKMPHCIIAGATGSGKSVCINSIIMSILMLSRPDEIKLLMIDPKKVELTPYTELPHMLAPVITDPHDAACALNWLVKEMEQRYELLKLSGQRNIEAFNKRKINKEAEAQAHLPIPEKLFYIVAIIDELADLMMASTQDIETPITRIAQMARAVGIHLILATQRPSREVITGLIKANFPSRISFKVASRINSQIVLDDVGAETLLGNGDMLILFPGLSHFIRAQGSFVHDDEIQSVVQCIQRQAPTNYLIKSFQKVDRDNRANNEPEYTVDSLFEEAKQIVFSTGNASTTFLQRKLKIGYARAASIMDQLEDQDIIGPPDGAKPRKIYFPNGMNKPPETLLEPTLEDESEV